MIRKQFIALLAAAGMALSAVAAAQEAYTTRQVNVRAGPERDFPLVATLAPGTPVHVNGCVADYVWCDIDFGGNRGWVIGRSLQYYYANRYVPLYSYAPTIGLPIVSFSLFPYWDTYYRNRPWYRDRPHWEQRWHAYDRPAYRVAPDYARPRQEFHPRIENRPPPQAYVPQQRYVEPQYRGRPNEPQFHQRGPSMGQAQPPQHVQQPYQRQQGPLRTPGPRPGVTPGIENGWHDQGQ